MLRESSTTAELSVVKNGGFEQVESTGMDLRQRGALAQASRYSFTRASVAARLRLSLSVQRTQLDSSAEARRCASIQPMPRPQSFLSSITRRHSLWVSGTAPGSASRLLKMTARFFRLPHASSPSTNGCVSNRRFSEEFSECRFVPAEVADPNGRIDEYHHLVAERRLGTARRFGSVPPRAASRFPDSRAISASKPARTKAVFSLIPESCLARSSRCSSIFNVVRICISMHLWCIPVKRPACSGNAVAPEAVSI